ncbi:MAG: GNAT family N-acetyltransferase [Candidatus Odinarchaeota archaeon]
MEYRRGYHAKIDDHYSIHIADDTEEELKDIIKINKEIHQDAILDTFIHHVFLEHPRKNEILWLYIKDNEQNKLVSSLCLAPSEWQIEDIRFPVCEMEFVGTLKDYRGKRFIKILNELYENIMEQEGYVLSVIKGIPYFYRALGYEYISSLDERITILSSKIPIQKFKDITIRKAISKDMPLIEKKYNQFHKKFYIFSRFDPECFRFKYLKEQFNSEVRTTYIFEKNGVSNNYFTLGLSYDHQNYEISSSDLGKREMVTLLQFIKIIGSYDDNDIITLSINENSPIFSFIKSLGGKPMITYGWQIKIPNLERFLYLIKNIIENRIQHSEFKGMTKIIRISNYHKTIILSFNNGKIDKIEVQKEFPDPKITDLMIPEALLFKILLGDRTIDEINYIIKDTIAKISSKSLIDTIFPKKKSLFSSYI